MPFSCSSVSNIRSDSRCAEDSSGYLSFSEDRLRLRFWVSVCVSIVRCDKISFWWRKFSSEIRISLWWDFVLTGIPRSHARYAETLEQYDKLDHLTIEWKALFRAKKIIMLGAILAVTKANYFFNDLRTDEIIKS